ncbi:hypothetical protein ERJ75_001712500 [Trypanosoma vivax]|nr:hypothetical protein ERJ75_001712500 [Trypanosoma vivax]
MIPLINSKLNLTVVQAGTLSVEKETATKVGNINQRLVQEYKALCSPRRQLSAMSSLLSNLEKRLLTKTTEHEGTREKEKEHMQAIKKYITTLKTVVPRSDFATTAMGHGQRPGTTPLMANAQPKTGKIGVYDAEKVKDDIKEMRDRVALTLKSLEGHVEHIKRKATRLSGKHSITEECGVPVHEITPNTLEAMTDELSNAERGIIPEDLRSNLKTVSNKWESLQKSMAELDKVAEVAKSDVNVAETQSKETELAVVKELVVKREEFCKVMDHLNAVKSHHNSLEARAREVQSGVQEAKKYEESAGTEAGLIQKYVKKIVATGARTKAAVVRAMGACRAAEAAAAEKDADVFASAAGACVAAKRADDEGRETEKTSSAVKGFEKKSGFALAGIRKSVKRTAVAEGTAFKSKENITGALHKIEAVVERVNKTFNDAVTKLPGLQSEGYMKECNKDGTAAAAESTVGTFEVNMQTLLQFVNESEGSIINNSVTVLRESTKQFDNALNEAKKFSANAKSESEQVKAIRAAIKSSAHVARETVRRAEDAAREAQEAASRVASGCEPLHRQLLSVLSGAV